MEYIKTSEAHQTSDLYPRIQELTGAKIHWYDHKDDVWDLKIDLSKYSEDDRQTLELCIGFLVNYVSMPAIEDNFKDERERHDWLADMSHDINEAYRANRLRGNQITTARGGIDLISNVFMDLSDDRAERCQVILDEMWKDYIKEDKDKISVSFADKLSGQAMEVLKMLEK